ncbi:hypothetical protein LAZ67_16001968 [Cordylochernes scorpioides]|uniref:Uncharacterized protein n=1 Tax=Cordylochernes scorpioides TaxID=51811 RepID=A0ABY6LCG9_9ARAC|nr:hypothetical protein LAZ67_16001968 [Cordylochernes scorpioides]
MSEKENLYEDMPYGGKYRPESISRPILDAEIRWWESFLKLDPDQKFPPLLPKNKHFTKLLIIHHHLRYIHASSQLFLSLIGNNY